MKRLLNLLYRFLFHPNKHFRVVITLVYTLAALMVNFFVLQVMCMPVEWLVIPLVLFIISIILFPYASGNMQVIMAFFLGIGVCISVYSIVFLKDPWGGFAGYIIYTIGIFAIGLGLLPFIFFYYLYHILRYFISGTVWVKKSMLTGIILPVIVIIFYLLPFKRKLDLFNKACGPVPDCMTYHHYNIEMESPELLKANIYTEQFLGIGIKYHTKIEYVYDGWRPPIHNPLLNIGLWLYSDTYYPKQYLHRTKYYKLFFPGKSYKYSCPCSYTYDGMTYLKGMYWHWDD